MPKKSEEEQRVAVHRFIKPTGKAAAPEKPEPEDKDERLTDLYARQTYWLRKDYIVKVQDYAYTERLSLRKAINKILEIAFQQIEKDYQENNVEWMHDEERGKL